MAHATRTMRTLTFPIGNTCFRAGNAIPSKADLVFIQRAEMIFALSVKSRA